MMSVMICTAHYILFGRLNQGERDEWGKWHEWERRHIVLHRVVVGKTLRKEATWKKA
jgi:hypothetical protein